MRAKQGGARAFLPEAGTGSLPVGRSMAGLLSKVWYRLAQHYVEGQEGEVSVPRGSAGSGANILFLVQLWPPSDLGVKLQSSPTAMIIFISLLCAAMSCSHQRQHSKCELLEFPHKDTDMV